MRCQVFQKAIELILELIQYHMLCIGRVVSPVSELFATKNKVECCMNFQMLID